VDEGGDEAVRVLNNAVYAEPAVHVHALDAGVLDVLEARLVRDGLGWRMRPAP
jgi:hypothetical protein